MHNLDMSHTEEAGKTIEEALRLILKRDNRQKLYNDALTDSLDAARYPILSGIVSYGPISTAELGRILGLDRSVVSRHSDQLEKEGFITKAPRGRATLLFATKEGEKTIGDIHALVACRITSLTESWSEDELTTFSQKLMDLAQALNEKRF